MNRRRLLSSACALTVLALLAGGCQRAAKTTGTAGSDVDQASLRFTGPYAHENLSVFLIHNEPQDERDFITLDEGLKEGQVTVTEKQQEQVSELLIDNQSDYPLFLQEGDRLSGGKQDRIIIASLVIPSKSGKMPLPAFCIEQGRWHAGVNGAAFTGTTNVALASRSVRLAAKFAKDQAQVWDSVRAEKQAAAANLGVSNTTSSLNEAFDAPQVKKVADEIVAKLGGILRDHPDAVGAAIVVNGDIEEVNIYPNHQLLEKLYPRLLQSYALAVTGPKSGVKEAKPVSVDEVAQYVKAGSKGRPERTDQLCANNVLQVSVSAAKVQCATAYEGRVVHQQILAKAK